MINDVILSNDEFLSLLCKVNLDKNTVDSVEELNSIFSPMLNFNGKSSINVDNFYLTIQRSFNQVSRRFNVILIDNEVWINLLSSIKLILNYNKVIIKRFDANLVRSLKESNIRLPFLDYNFYYKIYFNDYMKFTSIPIESRQNMIFNSIATYINNKKET